MKSQICCFAGHSLVENKTDTEKRVTEKCRKLILDYNIKNFWVGNYGDFDHIAARAVESLKQKYSDLSLHLVLPYLTKNTTDIEYTKSRGFDSVFIADIPERTPRRYHILKCNQYMIDNSKYLITYVKYTYGGAFQTLKYAERKKNIEIINLCN